MWFGAGRPTLPVADLLASGRPDERRGGPGPEHSGGVAAEGQPGHVHRLPQPPQGVGPDAG